MPKEPISKEQLLEILKHPLVRDLIGKMSKKNAIEAVSELRSPSNKRIWDLRVSIPDIITILIQIAMIVFIITVALKDIEAGQEDRKKIWEYIDKQEVGRLEMQKDITGLKVSFSSAATSIENTENNVERILKIMDNNRSYSFYNKP